VETEQLPRVVEGGVSCRSLLSHVSRLPGSVCVRDLFVLGVWMWLFLLSICLCVCVCVCVFVCVRLCVREIMCPGWMCE
jgi:hypothetical protein